MEPIFRGSWPSRARLGRGPSALEPGRAGSAHQSGQRFLLGWGAVGARAFPSGAPGQPKNSRLVPSASPAAQPTSSWDPGRAIADPQADQAGDSRFADSCDRLLIENVRPRPLIASRADRPSRTRLADPASWHVQTYSYTFGALPYTKPLTCLKRAQDRALLLFLPSPNWGCARRYAISDRFASVTFGLSLHWVDLPRLLISSHLPSQLSSPAPC